jgi:plastocyanin
MKPRTLIAMLAVAFLAIAVGLSTTVRTASAEATEVVIVAQDQAFVPSTVTVNGGGPVTIRLDNRDTFDNEHDIEVRDADFKTLAKTPGTCFGPCQLTLTFTPAAPGTYSFICIVHDDMNGVLIVN